MFINNIHNNHMFPIPDIALKFVTNHVDPISIDGITIFEQNNNIELPKDFVWYMTKVSVLIAGYNCGCQINLGAPDKYANIQKPYPFINNGELPHHITKPFAKEEDIVTNEIYFDKYISVGIIDSDIQYSDFNEYVDGTIELCDIDTNVYIGEEYTTLYYIVNGVSKGQVWSHTQLENNDNTTVKKMYDTFTDFATSILPELVIWIKHKEKRKEQRRKLIESTTFCPFHDIGQESPSGSTIAEWIT